MSTPKWFYLSPFSTFPRTRQLCLAKIKYRSQITAVWTNKNQKRLAIMWKKAYGTYRQSFHSSTQAIHEAICHTINAKVGILHLLHQPVAKCFQIVHQHQHRRLWGSKVNVTAYLKKYVSAQTSKCHEKIETISQIFPKGKILKWWMLSVTSLVCRGKELWSRNSRSSLCSETPAWQNTFK